MRYLILGLSCVVLSGCTQYAAPATPQEEEAKESRMRYYLQETSPRNSSGLPKVTPEFRKSFNLKKNSNSREESRESQPSADDLKSE